MPRSPGQPATAPCPRCGDLPDPSGGPVNFCPRCGNDLRAALAAEDAASSPWLHTIIADRYRLLALLGEGGMGAVYKAEHVRMGKVLALKLLRGDFARQPGAVARFRAEAQIVSRLSHPNTIAVFDFGEIDLVQAQGQPLEAAPERAGGLGGLLGPPSTIEGFYLAMEYVPGEDLADLLARAGPLPEGRAAALGAQVLGSLAEAHDAGIVHRDVKPANVMVAKTRLGEDLVKVLDFGIAKWRDERGGASETNVGAIIGTPYYLSPEQARGEELDGRADLYALGAVLYELVAGRPPFVMPNPMAVVAAHLGEPPPPLASVAPAVSKAFADVVHRALAKRPADRFASADEMREALLRIGHAHARRPVSMPVAATDDLQLASRGDFEALERSVRRTALKRNPVVAPALVVLVLAGALAWRWEQVYALLSARAPELAARLPATLRVADRYDGAEHEPNDAPGSANPLPDASAAGAPVRGRVGVRLSETEGDVDVYRVVVPPLADRTVLVAEWSGAREGEGIRGLDVALTLNRAPRPGAASAPLVAAADHGGVDRPETLVAAVEPGAYFLAVRERHADGEAPVEKPTDVYVLTVRLAPPPRGVEVEPNDAPSIDGGPLGWAAWRALAERNPLAAGDAIDAEIATDDADTFAVGAAPVAARPALLAAIPEAELALALEAWVADAEDLAPPAPQDRVRFARAAEAPPGAVLFLRVPPEPADAPVLVRVRADRGEGRYTVIALDAAGAGAVRARMTALAEGGRSAPALELAAGVVRHLPAAPGRAELLAAADAIARSAAAAMTAETFPDYGRAAELLGAPLFEASEGGIRYTGAFAALVAPSAPDAAPGTQAAPAAR